MLRTLASRAAMQRSIYMSSTALHLQRAAVAAPLAVATRRWNVRLNSSAADAARKAALEANDKLQKDWAAPIVTYEQLKPKTQAPSETAYLIDVREPDEVVQGSIPSAVNLPLSVIANSLHLDPTAFKAKHGFEKPQKAQEITFYCRSGKRSASASDIARRNGFTDVYNYQGSWLDWVEREGIKTPS